jgi:hypothetical protein
VQRRDCFVGAAAHLNEGKPLGALGFAVDDDLG